MKIALDSISLRREIIKSLIVNDELKYVSDTGESVKKKKKY